MKTITWVIFLVSASSLAGQDQLIPYWYPRCYGLKENVPQMNECCEIFSLSHTFESRELCAMECLQGDADVCCFDICFAERNGIFENGTFHREGLLNSITRNMSLDQSLLIVVENSLKKCLAARKVVQTTTCGIPDHIFTLTQCVLTENFINCPNVIESEECQRFKNFLAPCQKPTTPKPTKTTKKKVAAG